MSRGKPKEPENRIGVFRRYEDVPDKYRLRNFATQYEGVDTWAEFADAYTNGSELLDRSAPSKSGVARTERTGREWREFMEESRGRHHALARPEDVEAWAAQSLDKRAVHTTYRVYWTRIEAFFHYLQFHTDHPHRFHPALMAAANFEAAGEIWSEKLDSWGDDDE